MYTYMYVYIYIYTQHVNLWQAPAINYFSGSKWGPKEGIHVYMITPTMLYTYVYNCTCNCIYIYMYMYV